MMKKRRMLLVLAGLAVVAAMLPMVALKAPLPGVAKHAAKAPVASPESAQPEAPHFQPQVMDLRQSLSSDAAMPAAPPKEYPVEASKAPLPSPPPPLRARPGYKSSGSAYGTRNGDMPLVANPPAAPSPPAGRPASAFPCRPPAPSTHYDLTALLAGTGMTFGRIDDRLRRAFASAGYDNISYLSLDCDPDGIAIVTAMERFNEDGTPCRGSARWVPGAFVSDNLKDKLVEYLNHLFTASPGHYRILVFVVSNRPTQPDTAAKDVEKVAHQWLRAGMSRMPSEYREKQYTKAHGCEALVYEFEKTNMQTTFVDPSRLAGKIHLEKSGFLRQLELGGTTQ